MNYAEMPAGPEMDRLVAEAMGWSQWELDGSFITSGGTLRFLEDDGSLDPEDLFNPSTNIAHAWEVVAKIAPLVGDFKSGDGFFHLIYADSADHSQGEGCDPKRTAEDTEDDIDRERWSAHMHIGCVGANGGCPEHWDHGMKFCARGSAAPLAICRAALMALRPEGE